MTPYDILREIPRHEREGATFIWEKEEWNELKEFAEANGLDVPKNPFSYLGAYHYTE